MVEAPKPFSYNDRNRHTAAVRWPTYKMEFDYYLSASGVEESKQRKALLLWNGGEALRAVYRSKTKDEDKDSYEDACKLLGEHFKSGLNKDAVILMFRQAMQKESESLDDYVVRLRSIAKDCDFKDPEEQLRQQVLVGSSMNGIRGKMVTEACTLDQVLMFGKSLEAGEMMRGAMAVANGEARVAALRKGGDRQVATGNRRKEKRCYACGYEFPHKQKTCPAAGKRCSKCKRMGHFAKCCKSKDIKFVSK